MSNYKCSDCGMQAYSKCVYSRNIFPSGTSGQMDAMLSNLLKFESKPCENPDMIADKVTITYHTIANDIPEALENLLNTLKCMKEDDHYPSFEKYSCTHNWILQDETCSLGCCKKL